ncbi:hypothetical protein KKG29_01730 [Patescibacteria group bacterium]|nr:hypothetical protein [Patescibacteria group bacterium]
MRFVVPAHNSDIAIIGQKIFNRVVGARFSAAKLGEASRNRFEGVSASRKLLVDFLYNFCLFRLRHNVSQAVVINIAERFLSGPFASPQLGAVPSPNIFGQIVHIVFGV